VTKPISESLEEAARPNRAKGVPQRETDPVSSGGLAQLSIRLPAEIPQMLLRVSLDRKLKHAKPWTQQDIVAEAMMQWFKRNGCLDT